MRLGFTNKTENKNYLTEILQLPDLLPVLLIILISVCLAIIATYYSYTYLLAILLFVVAIIVFLKSPEWFFYFFAFFRISLDAIKLFSYFVPEIGRRWGLSLDGVITLLLLLCAVIYFTTRKNIDIFGLPGSRAYFIFLIIGLISLIFSLDKIVGIRRLIHYATYFLIYILGVNILNTKEKNYKMAYSIVFSSFIPLFVGFYQAVTGRGSLTSTGFNRIFATVSYPNAYAFYLMIILIFILTMYFYVGDIRKKLLLFLISIPMRLWYM